MTTITPFVPPASCTILQYGSLSGQNGIAIRQGVNCREGSLYWDNNCFPTTTPVVAAGCPVGWKSLSEFRSSEACCPSSYTLAVSPEYSCYLTISAWTAVPMTFCNSGNPFNTIVPSATFTAGSFFARAFFLTAPTPTPTPTPSRTILPSSPSSTPLGTTVTPATTATPTTATPTTASDTTKTSTSSVSKGTIAGIVVGVLALLAFVAAATFLLLRRRRREASAQPVSDAVDSTNTFRDTKAELPATNAVAAVKFDSGYTNSNGHSGSETTRPMHMTSSPREPSNVAELSAVSGPGGHASPPIWSSSSATQHTELPAHSYQPSASGMTAATSASQYVENTAPYYPEAYAAAPDPAHALKLVELETAQRELEERMARMRQLSALEEEHARTQAEIARLRNN